MRYLLDTHTFIWWAGNPEKLSSTALNVCENRENVLFLSCVSVWEMQIKAQIGKLRLAFSVKELVEQHRIFNRLEILAIHLSHIYRLEKLPMHHNDPFDRMLISQAIEENLILISKDTAFSNYDVNILWQS
ncbi:MAG: type II toxin-antitoxin system VapC family toxin [Desulfobacterales bacterium]